MNAHRLFLFCITLGLLTTPAWAAFTSRADTPPRKIVIGTALVEFSGPLAPRPPHFRARAKYVIQILANGVKALKLF